MSKHVEAKFIVCEDVRTETNGKLTLTGVYPSEIIVLNKQPADAKLPDKWLAVLPRLAFVGFLRGVPGGKLDGDARVVTPRGEVIMSADLRGVYFEDARPSTLILQGGAVGIPELGTYKAEFRVGDYKFAFDIEISAASDFQVPPRVSSTGEKTEKKGAKGPKKAGRISSRAVAKQ